jgi:hypothetical protein
MLVTIEIVTIIIPLFTLGILSIIKYSLYFKEKKENNYQSCGWDQYVILDK